MKRARIIRKLFLSKTQGVAALSFARFILYNYIKVGQKNPRLTPNIWFHKREKLNNSLFFKSPFSIFYYKNQLLGTTGKPLIEMLRLPTRR
jgi:hypothetical protein